MEMIVSVEVASSLHFCKKALHGIGESHLRFLTATMAGNAPALRPEALAKEWQPWDGNCLFALVSRTGATRRNVQQTACDMGIAGAI